MNAEANGRAASYAALAAVAFVAQQVTGRATRDALFLSVFDAVDIPRVMLGAAAFSLIAVALSARMMSRLGPAPTVPLFCGLSSLLFGFEAMTLPDAPGVIAVVNYLHMTAIGAVVLSGFWSIVNERFDPHTAKKVVSRITAGAALGGLAGGGLAYALSEWAELRTGLFVLAAINLLCAFGASQIGTGRAPVTHPSGTKGGLQAIRSSPYLRGIAVVVFLLAGAGAFFDYALKAVADTEFESSAELLSFFAVFYTATGLLTFLAQSGIAARALQRFGIGRTMALLPIGAILTGGGAALWPRLATIALAKGTQSVFSHSLFRSSYELLYTPVPRQSKRPAKPIIDVAADQLGDGTGSVIIIAILAITVSAETAMPAVIGLGMAAFAVALWFILRLNKGYVAELASSLRAGALEISAESSVDATTFRTVAEATRDLNRQAVLARVEARREETHGSRKEPWGSQLRALSSEDPNEVLLALRNDKLDRRFAARVIELVGVDTYRTAAEAALERMGAAISGQLVDALLDEELPAIVRRRLPQVMRASGDRRAARGLFEGLEALHFDVRKRCAAALVGMQRTDPTLTFPAQRIYEIAAGEAQSDPDHLFAILSLALDREALGLSRRALASEDPNLKGTALEYLYNVLPPHIRSEIWPRLAKGAPPPERASSASELVRTMESLMVNREELLAEIDRDES